MTDQPLFSSLELRPQLLNQLQHLGFIAMTPIQAAALPHVLTGADVVAQASTGSGKTAAFGLGCLQHLQETKFHVQSLVLCPTRELADQVANSFRSLAKNLANTKIVTLCGGVAIGPQIGSLQHSAHIIVGTPGRVLKHLHKGTLHLNGLSSLVLDEADRMLDMGFADEIDAILDFLPTPRQNLLFSATFPEEVAKVVAALCPDAVRVDVTQTEAAPAIDEYWCHAPYRDLLGRTQVLGETLHHFGGKLNLVFCNTKHECAEVSRTLHQLGIGAVALHGDMEQQARSQTLVRFANGSANVLVATDVAARGLDIDDVDAVFNFELPHQVENYVHRIGRTGRSGRNGTAISLVSDREMPRLKLIETNLKHGAMRLWRADSSGSQGAETSAQPSLATPTVYTLEINGGRKHKLRPGDILGALTAGGTLGADAVGKIDILPMVSYVAIAKEHTSAAQRLLNQHKIKGRQFRVRGVG
ncbi:MAG TPA: ATP-dependent RNA helicase DbpA [Gammaproteobacteria bacterium]|nr:ATP-dependent RNA helicase DbpA [Gammaproteobacteria bacterium]